MLPDFCQIHLYLPSLRLGLSYLLNARLVPRSAISAFAPQFDDLDSALVASVDHMEQSNLSSLEAAARDSELAVLQVQYPGTNAAYILSAKFCE